MTMRAIAASACGSIYSRTVNGLFGPVDLTIIELSRNRAGLSLQPSVRFALLCLGGNQTAVGKVVQIRNNSNLPGYLGLE